MSITTLNSSGANDVQKSEARLRRHRCKASTRGSTSARQKWDSTITLNPGSSQKNGRPTKA